jgi:hypothetical protein
MGIFDGYAPQYWGAPDFIKLIHRWRKATGD